MMETERPYRSTSINSSSNSSNTASELFICFTSRLSSSSSMKISSKSILSPGRARDSTQMSLSNSLSRRLRNSGSMKGGRASPMFSTGGRKRGCGFENPEPSSPKVTCIGQVRVKTKKQGKKMRACSSQKRADISFRKLENRTHVAEEEESEKKGDLNNNNQRWVHFPLTICEAFNCLFPCRASCMAGNNEDEKTGESCGTSCGDVFGRWVVAVEDGERKGREIELVVGGEDEEEEERRGIQRRRRHIFEDIEFDKIGVEGKKEEEEARVSTSIPPKNALLLMRCGSDPVKMAALANRFWEPPLPQEEEEEEEQEPKVVEEKDEYGQRKSEFEMEDERKFELCENSVSVEVQEPKVVEGKDEYGQRKSELEMEDERKFELRENSVPVEEQEPKVVEEKEVYGKRKFELEMKEHMFELCENSAPVGEQGVAEGNTREEEGEEENHDETDPDANEVRETVEGKEHENRTADEVRAEADENHSEEPLPVVSGLEILENSENEKITAMFIQKIEEDIRLEVESEAEQEQERLQVIRGDEFEIASQKQELEEDLAETRQDSEEEEAGRGKQEETIINEGTEPGEPGTVKYDPGPKSQRETTQNAALPDCVLLMMCELNLSMEVSRETWVRNTDFVRRLPERPPVKKSDGGDEPNKETAGKAPTDQALLKPPRSSCSFPEAPPLAAVVEQKLVGAKPYAPFVLTRCKSEPMRSSAKLVPEACSFWKNRKLEPHRSATVGIGAAGVGF